MVICAGFCIGVTECLFFILLFFWGVGSGGGRANGFNYLFPHHIYCAQSKVK